MANHSAEEIDETKITLSFTPEELEACFGETDDEKSDEEEFDVHAWRQGIRDAHRDGVHGRVDVCCGGHLSNGDGVCLISRAMPSVIEVVFEVCW